MRKNVKLLGAVAVAGLVATTGSAFTAGNTVAASVAGYGTSTISGATASSVSYTLNAAGTQITAASIVFTGDQTGRTVAAGFGSDALTSCTLAAHNASAGTTTASCTGFTASTASSTSFNVAVS